jgi:hypothetical protein
VAGVDEQLQSRCFEGDIFVRSSSLLVLLHMFLQGLERGKEIPELELMAQDSIIELFVASLVRKRFCVLSAFGSWRDGIGTI